jgi:hypothetical protein
MSGDDDNVCSIGVQTRVIHYYYGNSSWHLSPGVCWLAEVTNVDGGGGVLLLLLLPHLLLVLVCVGLWEDV